MCLGPKNIAKFCRVKGVSCVILSRRHPLSVCDQNEAKPDTDKSSTVTILSPVSSTVKLKQNKQNTVLLQTFKLWTDDPVGRKIVHCLLDGGSQRSFVHEGVAKALKLPVVRQETLHLQTFDSTTPVAAQHNVVRVSLENVWNMEQRVEIEAVETLKVSTAIIKVPGLHIQRSLREKVCSLLTFH